MDCLCLGNQRVTAVRVGVQLVGGWHLASRRRAEAGRLPPGGGAKPGLQALARLAAGLDEVSCPEPGFVKWVQEVIYAVGLGAEFNDLLFGEGVFDSVYIGR